MGRDWGHFLLFTVPGRPPASISGRTVGILGGEGWGWLMRRIYRATPPPPVRGVSDLHQTAIKPSFFFSTTAELVALPKATAARKKQQQKPHKTTAEQRRTVVKNEKASARPRRRAEEEARRGQRREWLFYHNPGQQFSCIKKGNKVRR